MYFFVIYNTIFGGDVIEYLLLVQVIELFGRSWRMLCV